MADTSSPPELLIDVLVARVAVPRFADWCCVFIREGEQRILTGKMRLDVVTLELSDGVSSHWSRTAGFPPWP